MRRQAFRGKWDKEVDHSYPLDDLEGIVDASILKKAPPKAQHPYGMLRLRLSFAATEFGSDDEFSDEDTADVEMAAAEGSEEEGTSSSEDELRARCARKPSLALFPLAVDWFCECIMIMLRCWLSYLLADGLRVCVVGSVRIATWRRTSSS